jgi:hypothetical protein
MVKKRRGVAEEVESSEVGEPEDLGEVAGAVAEEEEGAWRFGGEEVVE